MFEARGVANFGTRCMSVKTDIGQPVILLAGYRHIGLRNEFNQPQGVATIFVHIQVKDYINDAFAGNCFALYFSVFFLVFVYNYELILIELISTVS